MSELREKNDMLVYMRGQIEAALRYMVNVIPPEKESLLDCLRSIDSALTDFCQLMMLELTKEKP